MDQKKIIHIRGMIAKMRDRRSGFFLSEPIPMWEYNIKKFDYLLTGEDLAPFSQLRKHTGHITGDPNRPVQKVSFAKKNKEYFTKNILYPPDFILEALAKLHLISFRSSRNLKFRKWLNCLSLPDSLLNAISEPELLGGESIQCTTFHSRRYNYDTSRFLVEMANLYESNTFDFNQEGAVILDIGGGWGGLAYCMSKIFKNSHLSIVDLPETFIFSIPYLTLIDETKKVYIHDENQSPNSVIKSHDYSFFPPEALDKISDNTYDLIVNTGSMAEMSEKQVREYIKHIKRVGKGLFFSFNERKQIRNGSIVNLTDILNDEFNLSPGPYSTEPLHPLICQW